MSQYPKHGHEDWVPCPGDQCLGCDDLLCKVSQVTWAPPPAAAAAAYRDREESKDEEEIIDLTGEDHDPLYCQDCEGLKIRIIDLCTCDNGRWMEDDPLSEPEDTPPRTPPTTTRVEPPPTPKKKRVTFN